MHDPMQRNAHVRGVTDAIATHGCNGALSHSLSHSLYHSLSLTQHLGPTLRRFFTASMPPVSSLCLNSIALYLTLHICLIFTGAESHLRHLLESALVSRHHVLSGGEHILLHRPLSSYLLCISVDVNFNIVIKFKASI